MIRSTIPSRAPEGPDGIATKIETAGYTSGAEKGLRERFLELFRDCPIPDSELLANLALFVKRQDLSHMLMLDEVYRKILDVHGVLMEFGVRWGRNLALFESLRGIHEPFNHNRKIVGFDTFEGFPSTHDKDGDADIVHVGAYDVTERYEEFLEEVLAYHEQESPIPHLRKFELVKGDANVTVEKYLEAPPETIVALAYFDMDIYEPTRKCLELLVNHVTRGSVLVFDELNLHEFPGETLALKDVFGLDRFKIRRSPYGSVQSYLVIE